MLTVSQIRESLNRMEDFLKILQDDRINDRGTDLWKFKLVLWGKEADRNLAEFDKLWEGKRSPQSKAVTGTAQPKAKPLPDAPQHYIWVQRQLEAVSKYPKTTRKDFFEGVEATWQDILAGYDVVRDVHGQILKTAEDWREDSDVMAMVLIQGRSGDGKSTVLRRVAVGLVGQGYSVLWYKGWESLQAQELERLAEGVENLVVCVDDLAKLMPEEIERTLRSLQSSSVRIFWVATVREDLWSAMNLPLRNVVRLHEVSVRRLSDGEINGLLDRLGEYDELGALKGLSREQQIAKLRDNADRQLLVVLLEAKYNECLGEYVRRNLNELEQKFGKVMADACYLTCAVQRFGLEVPIEHFQEILGVLSPRADIFSKTEGFLYPPSAMNGHPGVHVRHSVIATIAFEQDSAAYERLERFVDADLKFQNSWKQTVGLCHNIRLQMRSGQFDLDQVRRIFERAAEDVRSQKYVLNIWAILEKQAGNIKQARKLFERGSKAAPNHAPTWQAWAILERDIGNFDRARELFECGSKADPNHAPIWQAWAILERDIGNFDRARELFEQGSKADPKHAPIWQAWAILELEENNLDLALKFAEKAVQCQPKGIYPQLARGQVYLAIGREEQGQKDLLNARNELQRKLTNNTTTKRDLNILAHILILLKDYEQAELILYRSIEIFSSIQQQCYAYNGFGELYEAQGKIVEAIEAWQKAIDLSPHYVPARKNLKRVQREE